MFSGYRNLSIPGPFAFSEFPPVVCGDCAECLVKCSIASTYQEDQDVIRLRDVPAEFIA